MSLNDMSGTFPIYVGTLLAYRYEVQAFLGEGTFGKVAKCVDTLKGKQVAIKITKDNPIFTEQVKEEIYILEKLRSLDPDKCNLVRWNDLFFHDRFICLGFELLDMSLYELMLKRHNKPLPLAEIRPILHQLGTALVYLKHEQIMHTDLKPENIMLVDHTQKPFRVKIIDFGLACQVSDAVPGSCIQTLWYRSPEVILGALFMEPIDIWSLGLVVAELALGRPIFPGYNEYEMVKFIVDTMGQPPDYQLQSAQYICRYFHYVPGSDDQRTWKLKAPDETPYKFRDKRRICSVDDMMRMIPCRDEADWSELQNFVDLLKKMLLVDKYARIVPLQVLMHPFFTREQQTGSSLTRNSGDVVVEVGEEEEEAFRWQPPTQPTLLHTVPASEGASRATTGHERMVFPLAKRNFHNVEDAGVQSRTVIPHRGTVLPTPEMASAILGDAECQSRTMIPHGETVLPASEMVSVLLGDADVQSRTMIPHRGTVLPASEMASVLLGDADVQSRTTIPHRGTVLPAPEVVSALLGDADVQSRTTIPHGETVLPASRMDSSNLEEVAVETRSVTPHRETVLPAPQIDSANPGGGDVAFGALIPDSENVLTAIKIVSAKLEEDACRRAHGRTGFGTTLLKWARGVFIP